ncbi:MAG: lipopolysaccharide biosynthesis protein [Roseivirga sp.]
MEKSELKKRTFKALLHNFFDKAGTQVLAFVISIVLARILEPRDFGLIAMVNVFIQIANTFVDSGFGTAIIQRTKVSKADISSVFYFNMLVAILLYLVIFLCAPAISAFYNEPQLVMIARILGLNLIINAIGSIQLNLMIKNLDYSSQMKASMIALTFSGILGVWLAFEGYGVWAIVFQITFLNLIKNLCYWFWGKHKWLTGFSFASLKSMLGFSSKILFASILDILFNNTYVVIIGKYFSTEQLGFYRRARTMQEMPTTLLAKVQKVIFPSLTSFQNDDEKLKSIFRKSLQLTAFLTAPMMIGLAIIAEPLVQVLLTEKWLPSVPYIRLFCIAGFYFTLSSLIINVLFIKGNSGIYLKLEIIKKLVMLAILIPSIQWGIYGIVTGYSLSAVVCHFINVHYTGKELGYRIKEHLADILPSVVYATVLVGPVWLISELIESNALKLICQILTSLVLYIGGTYLLGSRELKALLALKKMSKAG